MKTLKAIVPSGGAGLMRALVLSMFFVSLFSLIPMQMMQKI